MADRVLRDHSELCEHGSFASRYAHKLHPTKEGYAFEMCPGGREVTDADVRELGYQVWLKDQTRLIDNPNEGEISWFCCHTFCPISTEKRHSHGRRTASGLVVHD